MARAVICGIKANIEYVEAVKLLRPDCANPTTGEMFSEVPLVPRHDGA